MRIHWKQRTQRDTQHLTMYEMWAEEDKALQCVGLYELDDRVAPCPYKPTYSEEDEPRCVAHAHNGFTWVLREYTATVTPT